MKALLTFRGYIDNVVERFVAHLDGFASSGKPFDLAHELAKLAADVASELAFGGGLKCIEGDPMGVLDAVEQSQIAGALIGRMPSLQPIFFNAAVQRLLAGSPVSKTFAALGQHVDDQVKSHMAQPDARHDMLSLMLESALRGASKKADSGERPIPLDNIALESFGIALAGTDTTSITMAAFFSYVLRDPRVLALLQAECDEHRNPDEEVRLHVAMRKAA
jgi:cytochrome P450